MVIIASVGQEIAEKVVYVNDFLSFRFVKFLTMIFFVAGSSWYLLCESCREKYVKNNRGGKQTNKSKRETKKKNYVKNLPSPTASIGLEAHIIMKNNAMFLLDLASSADTG